MRVATLVHPVRRVVVSKKTCPLRSASPWGDQPPGPCCLWNASSVSRPPWLSCSGPRQSRGLTVRDNVGAVRSGGRHARPNARDASRRVIASRAWRDGCGETSQPAGVGGANDLRECGALAQLLRACRCSRPPGSVAQGLQVLAAPWLSCSGPAGARGPLAQLLRACRCSRPASVGSDRSNSRVHPPELVRAGSGGERKLPWA